DSGSGAVDTFEDVAIALGLKAPKVTDNVDQTGAADNVDNPELLGVITLSGFPEGSTLLFGSETHEVTQAGSVKVVLTDGSHTSDALNDTSALKMTTAEFEALKVLPPEESHENFDVTATVT